MSKEQPVTLGDLDSQLQERVFVAQLEEKKADLRATIATAVMQALLTGVDEYSEGFQTDTAKCACEFADALLAELYK